MTAYYNEIDPFAAEWLRNLIDAGHIAPGVVDTRSITEVTADDLAGFTQCHFFAGIGGWSLAARLAGIPDDYPIWTASCPCQPFSVAGRQRGVDDERHLWPVFRDLIAQCRPAVVAGEQVASKAGRAWLSGVLDEVEGLGYAGAGADLCAAGVGAPHIRQRLYWAALAEHVGRHGGAAAGPETGHGGPGRAAGRLGDAAGASGADRGLGHAKRPGLEGHPGHEPDGHEPGRDAPRADRPAAPAGGDCGVADAESRGRDRRADKPRREAEARVAAGGRGASSGGWDDVIWLPCADGKARPIEPGLEPLAHGVPGRVGRVRAYGNAIVPELAAEFLMAALEEDN